MEVWLQRGKGILRIGQSKTSWLQRLLSLFGILLFFLPIHSNALSFEALGNDEIVLDAWTAYSIGGGTIIDDAQIAETKLIYPDTGMDNILKWCYQSGKSIWEYASEYETPDLWDYLNEVWKVMQDAITRGLDTEGPLPGELHYPRKASAYYVKARNFKSSMKKRGMIYAYALAVSEENASGGKIVTAPTCGACGVMPSVLYYMKKFEKASDKKILKALATAGIIGNVVKQNASISGAEVGCQGEVGDCLCNGFISIHSTKRWKYIFR